MRPPLNPQIQKQIIEFRKLGYTYTKIRHLLHITRGQIAGVLYRNREKAKDEAAERAIQQALGETNERIARQNRRL